MVIIRILVAVFLALLQGCSVTRIAYDNADMLLRWQASNYFDFHDEQSGELDQRIAAFLAWHRSRALPQYARLAEEASKRMLRGITREDLDWGYDSFRAQAREALGKAAAEIAGMLDHLSPEQIAHLEKRLAEENRKFAKEQLQGTVEDRRKRRLKRNLDRLEEWFGPLNEGQAERVRRHVARAPLGGELRDRDRKRRQTEFVAMLRMREAKQRLAQWAPAWEQGREPAYAAFVRELQADNFDLLLELDRTLSSEQRETAAAKFRDYAATFDSLGRR